MFVKISFCNLSAKVQLFFQLRKILVKKKVFYPFYSKKPCACQFILVSLQRICRNNNV